MMEQLKPKVQKIISEFRALSALSSSEVRINELSTEQGVLRVKGVYDCQNIFAQTIEKGTFDVKFSQDKLEPTSVKIAPTGGFRKRD